MSVKPFDVMPDLIASMQAVGLRTDLTNQMTRVISTLDAD